MPKKIIIAIDGPASSGKSTVARLLAKKLDYLYVDTGAMYRTVSLAAQLKGIDPSNHEAMSKLAHEAKIELKANGGSIKVFLEGREVGNEIRTPDISKITSQFTANVPGVRQALVAKQQQLGRDGGVVMEGRDISTVVFPRAELKIFLNASAHERARRRIKDFQERGIPCDEKSVAADIQARDTEDRARPFGALKQAEDAVVLTADGKDPETIVAEILQHWPALNA